MASFSFTLSFDRVLFASSPSKLGLAIVPSTMLGSNVCSTLSFLPAFDPACYSESDIISCKEGLLALALTGGGTLTPPPSSRKLLTSAFLSRWSVYCLFKGVISGLLWNDYSVFATLSHTRSSSSIASSDSWTATSGTSSSFSFMSDWSLKRFLGWRRIEPWFGVSTSFWESWVYWIRAWSAKGLYSSRPWRISFDSLPLLSNKVS